MRSNSCNSALSSAVFILFLNSFRTLGSSIKRIISNKALRWAAGSAASEINCSLKSLYSSGKERANSSLSFMFLNAAISDPSSPVSLYFLCAVFQSATALSILAFPFFDAAVN